jgi:predicted RNA binding protein YcfA (HicA-like mRNA interferase family)
LMVRFVVRLLMDAGWVHVPTRAPHVQFKHPRKPGRVTETSHANHDVAPGTLKSILRQAQLTEP